MKHLQQIYHHLCVSSKTHEKQIYNYTIPQSWNTFGYSKGLLLRSGELLVNPYEYTCFALQQILKDIEANPLPLLPLSKVKEKQGSWIQKQVLYFADIRTLGCWDHDRSDQIEKSNLYGFADQGTFLKAILLLPLLKRAGITTLVLPNILAMGKPKEAHDYADFHAITSLTKMDACYDDPLLDEISLEDQFHAFIEACHGLGIRILFGVSPALMARDNDYVIDHPEWFYWIRKECEYGYAAPHVNGLPENCTPSDKVCQLLYTSDSGKAHMEAFVQTPTSLQAKNLSEIERQIHITTAPMITDQVNTSILPQRDYTMVRFYEDGSKYKEHDIPCLLQDQVRMDLYPGKQSIRSLWDTLLQAYSTFASDYQIDGFYLMNPYMVPTAFIKEMITTLRKKQKHVAFLLEHIDMYETTQWKKLGIDAITGASAYDIHEVMGHQYHNFTYSLRQLTLPVCAASEFLDTPRIVQYNGGETLSNLLSIMNLFLPKAIPTFMSGQLALEKQPQYLSCFADQAYLDGLDRKNPHYKRQAMLDQFSYDYTRRDFHVFINQMEKFAEIRNLYLDAITDNEHCIPVWFDDPKDPGIGFTYVNEDKALLVVCNTNIYEEVDLHIHTENMLWSLPFPWKNIHQRYSSHDPFVHELQLDALQMISLHFGIGEVKIIEFT